MRVPGTFIFILTDNKLRDFGRFYLVLEAVDVTPDVTDVMKKDKDFSTVAAVSLSRMECI